MNLHVLFCFVLVCLMNIINILILVESDRNMMQWWEM